MPRLLGERLWTAYIDLEKHNKSFNWNFELFSYLEIVFIPLVPERFSEWFDIHLYCIRRPSWVGMVSVWKKTANYSVWSHGIKGNCVPCNASIQTIQRESVNHRSSCENVSHTQPNDCDHRSNNRFRNICCHIYLFLRVCRSSKYRICWEWNEMDQNICVVNKSHCELYNRIEKSEDHFEFWGIFLFTCRVSCNCWLILHWTWWFRTILRGDQRRWS